MGTKPENWETIKALFEEALDLNSGDRQAFLSRRCPDPQLRGEVERLLIEHEQAGAFLSTPVLGRFPLDSETADYRFSPGDRLAGRFCIIRYIAGGGMGEVYEAEDLELREHVALKTIRSEILRQTGAVTRFKREVHLARKVTHPNVCRIFDLFRHKSEQSPEETVFVSMELLQGCTLSTRLKNDGRMSAAAALPLATQMASALAAAHSAGIIHRDFKPGNVVLVPAGTEGAGIRAVVTDFGLALQSEGRVDTLSLTTGGAFLGTPAYMAPEQVEGRQATAATDIYALGLVMYEMVTGVRPFQGDTPISTAVKRLSEAPPPPRRFEPELSPWLESVILRCLERDPAKRFPDAETLLQALHEPSGQSKPASILRHPAVVLAACFLLAVALTLTFRYRGAIRNEHQQAAKQIVPRRSIAVLGFKNLSGKPEEAWLSTALSEMLTTELAAGEKLRTVPGENVALMRASLALPDADSYGKPTLSRIHSLVNADDVVVGSYLALGGETGGKVRLELKLQDARAGETTAVLVEEGTEGELPELVSRAGGDMLEKLGVSQLSTDERGAVNASISSSPEANRFYAQGLEKLRRFDLLASKDLLEKAVAADANFALAHRALSEVWSKLGYDSLAEVEGKKAVQLSAGLSREDRLLIEGEYQEALHAWEKADQAYRSLFTFFPDNLEYGLRLAEEQTAAGKGRDALATAAVLRQLPDATGRDPRIDLADARAAQVVGDYAREQASAAVATNEGLTHGARLISASGFLEQCIAFRFLGKPTQGAAACKSAEQIFDLVGDSIGVARARNNLANLLADAGDAAGATKLYQQAQEAFHKSGNKRGEAASLTNLALLIENDGDLSKAQSIYQQAFELYRDTGSKPGMGVALVNHASVLEEVGNYSGARQKLDQALILFREVGNQDDAAMVINNLGDEALALGDISEATTRFEEAARIWSSLGHRNRVAVTQNSLANVASQQGDLSSAKELSEKALKVFREQNYKEGIATALNDRGVILFRAGDLEEAVKLQEEARTLALEIQQPPIAAAADVALAEILAERGQAKECQAKAESAVTEFHKEQNLASEANAQAIHALCAAMQDRFQEADENIAKANALAVRSQIIDTQLNAKCKEARLNLISMHPERLGKARTLASTALSEAHGHGFVWYEMEARLLAAEAGLASVEAAVERERISGVEADARAKGFLIIAGAAHRDLERSQGSTRRKTPGR